MALYLYHGSSLGLCWEKIWVIETFLNWTTEKMKENIKALVSGLLKENAFSQAHFFPPDWLEEGR